MKNRTETISNQIKWLVSLWMTQYDTTYIEETNTQMKVVLIIIRRPLRCNWGVQTLRFGTIQNVNSAVKHRKQSRIFEWSLAETESALLLTLSVMCKHQTAARLLSEALRLWADVGAPSQNLWNQQQQTTAGRVESSTETNTAPSAAVSSSVSDVTITQ